MTPTISPSPWMPMSQMGVVPTLAANRAGVCQPSGPPGNPVEPDCTAVTAWTFSRRLWSLVANAVADAAWAIANKPKQVHGILVPLRLGRAAGK